LKATYPADSKGIIMMAFAGDERMAVCTQKRIVVVKKIRQARG
jgi:hypothetical protein